ncbi:hypothetical protein L3V82_04210 [Thiotrichales bacterium 19S3-7]|nr:hypothetical protein [Thiotrichales bacterium 19S3-7]MCF6802675.1 hypothetical protein [Thiotrichales bacterium 19S3-11]
MPSKLIKDNGLGSNVVASQNTQNRVRELICNNASRSLATHFKIRENELNCDITNGEYGVAALQFAILEEKLDCVKVILNHQDKVDLFIESSKTPWKLDDIPGVGNNINFDAFKMIRYMKKNSDKNILKEMQQLLVNELRRRLENIANKEKIEDSDINKAILILDKLFYLGEEGICDKIKGVKPYGEGQYTALQKVWRNTEVKYIPDHFIQALKSGDIERFKKLLEKDPNLLNTPIKNKYMDTPLVTAVYFYARYRQNKYKSSKYKALAEFLLDQEKIDLFAVSTDNETVKNYAGKVLKKDDSLRIKIEEMTKVRIQYLKQNPKLIINSMNKESDIFTYYCKSIKMLQDKDCLTDQLENYLTQNNIFKNIDIKQFENLYHWFESDKKLTSEDVERVVFNYNAYNDAINSIEKFANETDHVFENGSYLTNFGNYIFTQDYQLLNHTIDNIKLIYELTSLMNYMLNNELISKEKEKTLRFNRFGFFLGKEKAFNAYDKADKFLYNVINDISKKRNNLSKFSSSISKTAENMLAQINTKATVIRKHINSLIKNNENDEIKYSGFKKYIKISEKCKSRYFNEGLEQPIIPVDSNMTPSGVSYDPENPNHSSKSVPEGLLKIQPEGEDITRSYDPNNPSHSSRRVPEGLLKSAEGDEHKFNPASNPINLFNIENKQVQEPDFGFV